MRLSDRSLVLKTVPASHPPAIPPSMKIEEKMWALMWIVMCETDDEIRRWEAHGGYEKIGVTEETGLGRLTLLEWREELRNFQQYLREKCSYPLLRSVHYGKEKQTQC
jgi:hypothetical protein